MKSLTVFFVFIIAISASADVNSIFIGKFFDFVPRNYGRSKMKEYVPSFNDSCLFVWIEQNACSTSIDNKEPLSDLLKSTYVSNGSIFHYGDTLKAGSLMYFICRNRIFETRIEKFLLYSHCLHECGYDIYAICSIPDTMKGDSSLFSGRYAVICSTNEDMKIYYDKTEIQNRITDYETARGYEFFSYLEDTGEKGKYDENIYRSEIQVKYNRTPIFDTGMQVVPFEYIIGDFNGNGKVDLFLFLWDWDQIYTIIEFDRNAYQTKIYIDPSGC